RPLTLAQTISYFGQISSALSFAHSRQVIHRDIKPNNLMLSGDRSIVEIADFGVARIAASDSDEITRVGTNLYAPPEHHPDSQTSDLRQSLTPSADVYSMAKTIFTAMTGRSPHQFIRQPVSSLPEELCGQPCGSRLLAILGKATCSEVESRYQSVKEFWDDFSALAAVTVHGTTQEDPEATLVRSRESRLPDHPGSASVAYTASAAGSNNPSATPHREFTVDAHSNASAAAGVSTSSGLAESSGEAQTPLNEMAQPMFHPQSVQVPAGDRPRPQKARIVIPLPERADRVQDSARTASGVPPQPAAVEVRASQAIDGAAETVIAGPAERYAATSGTDATPARVQAARPIASAKVGLMERIRRDTQWNAWVRRMFVIC